MSSERCSPHTEQVGMIILFHLCIFMFFINNLSRSGFNILYERISNSITSTCINVFQVTSSFVSYTEEDAVINHWTILRELN